MDDQAKAEAKIAEVFNAAKALSDIDDGWLSGAVILATCRSRRDVNNGFVSEEEADILCRWALDIRRTVTMLGLVLSGCVDLAVENGEVIFGLTKDGDAMSRGLASISVSPAPADAAKAT